MRRVQFNDTNGRRRVAAADGAGVPSGAASVRDVALPAVEHGTGLAEAASAPADNAVGIGAPAADGRLPPPLDHPDPACCLVIDMGPTRLSSADARDKMHATLAADVSLTASAKIFKMGLDGGEPEGGTDGNVAGVQPEWF